MTPKNPHKGPYGQILESERLHDRIARGIEVR